MTETPEIVKTKGTVGGKARIQGTRTRVMDIVKRHEILDETPEEIAEAFEITVKQVYQALSYYEDHRKEIRKDIQEQKEFIQEAKQLATA